jgi:hypothetical protein
MWSIWKIFKLSGILFLVFSLYSCFGEDQTDEVPFELIFSFDDAKNHYIVSGYEGSGIEILVIPSQYEGYEVSVIQAYALLDAKIDTIVIPNTIKTIERYAFSSSSIKEVIISNQSNLESIDLMAFLGSSVNHLFIPKEAVVYFEHFLTKLESFEVDPEHMEYQSIDGVVYSKDGTRLIKVAEHDQKVEFMIPEGVIEIESRSLLGQQHIKVVHVPDSVRFIRDAFRSSQIEEIIFGEESQLNIIGYHAFSYSKIKSIQVPNTITEIGEHAFEGSMIGEITFGEQSYLRTVGEFAFSDTVHLKSITFPSTLETVNRSTFSGSGVESIIFLSGSFTLLPQALGGTDHLSSIEIIDDHESYTTIDDILYSSDLRNLIHYPKMRLNPVLTLPNSLFHIPDSIFNGTKIEQFKTLFNPHYEAKNGVLFSKDLKTLVFYPVARDTSTYQIPLGTEVIGRLSFQSVRFLETLIVASSVIDIGSSAFADSSISYLSWMPNSAPKRIYSYAFSNVAIRHLVIPSTIIYIEENAFANTKIHLLEFDQDLILIIRDDMFNPRRVIHSVIMPKNHQLSPQTLGSFSHLYIHEGIDLNLQSLYVNLYFESSDELIYNAYLGKSISVVGGMSIEAFRQSRLSETS